MDASDCELNVPAAGASDCELNVSAAGAEKKREQKFSENDKKITRLVQVLEVIILIPVILVILGIFLIPTILYALPDASSNPPMMNGSMEGMMETMRNVSMMSIPNLANLTPTCSEGFYLDDGVNGTNTCRPECGEFLRTPFVRQFFERFSIVVGIIASVLVLIIAATAERQKLLVFPSIILVYICISSIILNGIFFIGFLDNYGLYCGQRDYLFLLGKGNETPYTIVTGLAFVYFVIQLDAWAAVHSIFLFWGVRFPFNYRSLKASGNVRYAHIISVLLVVILPIPGPFIILKDGYLITDNPNLVAAGRNPDLTYFFFTLPSNTLLFITSVMLFLLFWTVFKEFVLKKLLAKKRMGKVGSAEFKIIFILVYFAIFALNGAAAFTYLNENIGLRNSIFAYIGCETSGFAPINCFDLLDTRSRDTAASLLSVSIISLILFPVVVLIFMFNPRLFKEYRSKLSRPSNSESGSSTTPVVRNMPTTQTSLVTLSFQA